MSVTEIDPSTIDWSEPPSRPNSGKYTGLVAVLREHPGEWAIVRKDAPTGNVQDLRQHKGVESTSRPNGDGTSTVWARWVGVDDLGETVLSPEAQARRDARAARKAAREAAAEAAL